MCLGTRLWLPLATDMCLYGLFSCVCSLINTYLTSRMVLLIIIVAGRCIVMSPEGHVMCVCVCGALQDMGTVVLGKVESGGVMKGSSLLLMPNRVSV